MGDGWWSGRGRKSLFCLLLGTAVLALVGVRREVSTVSCSDCIRQGGAVLERDPFREQMRQSLQASKSELSRLEREALDLVEEGEEEDGGARKSVKKTIFREKARVVWITGLRHFGEKTWRAAIDQVCHTGDVECIPLCGSRLVGHYYRLNYVSFAKAKLELFKELEMLSQKTASEKTRVFFLNLYGECKGESLRSISFPIREHVLDPVMQPPIGDFARLAELAGVDLRIVFVTPRRIEPVVETWFDKYKASSYAKTGFHVVRSLQITLEFILGHLTYLDKHFLAAYVVGEKAITFSDTEKTLDEWTALPGLAAAVQRGIDEGQRTKDADKKEKNNLAMTKEDMRYVKERVSGVFERFLSMLGVEKSPPSLQKTVFSSGIGGPPIMVFFAGLEGTGHHLFSHVLGREKRRNGHIDMSCEVSDTLYQANTERSLWECSESSVYWAARKELTHNMKLVSNSTEYKDKVLLLNTVKKRSPECLNKGGELSYPNFYGHFKPFQVPDILALAQESEAAGIDFRVVLLTREVEDMVISTTVHRHFGGHRELNILETAAYSLQAQVDALDKRFFLSCVDYARDVDMSYVPPMAKLFRLPGMIDAFRDIIHFKNSTRTVDLFRHLALVSLNMTMNHLSGVCH